MELLATRIGTTIHYCKPYTPTAKAKVERWFQTMKDQWMASLDMRDFPSRDAQTFLGCEILTLIDFLKDRGLLYTYLRYKYPKFPTEEEEEFPF